MDREILLEKYIQGKLTEKEQHEFDSLLDTDDGFKENVLFHTNLKRVAEAEDDDDFRAILNEFKEEAEAAEEANLGTDITDIGAESSTSKSIFRRIPAKWLAAASIALLVGIGYFFVIDQNISSQQLYAENFEPYPNVVHPIVRGEEDESAKTAAYSAYENGEYETAAVLFTELYTETKETPYLFYRANALLQLNRATEAIPLLEEHLNAEDKLSDKTAWYLAMAYLKIDDRENAVKMLETVLAHGKFNGEEAERLLKALK